MVVLAFFHPLVLMAMVNVLRWEVHDFELVVLDTVHLHAVDRLFGGVAKPPEPQNGPTNTVRCDCHFLNAMTSTAKLATNTLSRISSP